MVNGFSQVRTHCKNFRFYNGVTDALTLPFVAEQLP